MKKSPGAFVAKSKRKKATARAGHAATPSETKRLNALIKKAEKEKKS